MCLNIFIHFIKLGPYFIYSRSFFNLVFYPQNPAFFIISGYRGVICWKTDVSSTGFRRWLWNDGVGESLLGTSFRWNRALPQLTSPPRRKKEEGRGRCVRKESVLPGVVGGSPQGWGWFVMMGSVPPSWVQRDSPPWRMSLIADIYWASTRCWALGAVQMPFVILQTTWTDKHHYPHFTKAETKALRD